MPQIIGSYAYVNNAESAARELLDLLRSEYVPDGITPEPQCLQQMEMLYLLIEGEAQIVNECLETLDGLEVDFYSLECTITDHIEDSDYLAESGLDDLRSIGREVENSVEKLNQLRS